MNREPIRIPAIVVSAVLLIVFPAVTSLLEGRDWRDTLLLVIPAVAVLLGGAETARAFVDSPETRARYDAVPRG